MVVVGRAVGILVGACVASAAVLAAQPSPSPDEVSVWLRRIGEQVEQYLARAASVMCREVVLVQTLGSDLISDGSRAREIVSDLRVAWEPAADGGMPEARVLRDVLTVNGRPPRARDEAGCMDPKPVSPEPLTMLRPREQGEYTFRSAGRGRTDGRAALMFDYRSVAPRPADVIFRDECVSIALPGRARGRIWADPETGDVLRIDESLIGTFDFRVPREHSRAGGPASMTIERADTSIRYRQVTFRDPEETLMLPASVESLTIIRNSGAPRVRKTQRFSNYRRFVTEGRIVPEAPGPEL
jgi:hypothetical protein